jgi:hypothetical protein
MRCLDGISGDDIFADHTAHIDDARIQEAVGESSIGN